MKSHSKTVGQTIVFRGLPGCEAADLLYRRRLPHWIPEGKAVALGFRLAGSLPRAKPEILVKNPASRGSIDSPLWLYDPRVAEVVEKTLVFGAETREWYSLWAYVIMPNHVHVLLDPSAELPRITQWLKGRTARVCNRILNRTGPFWQDESYDHWMRCYDELEETARYIENNPVRAGFVAFPDQWRWSSATARQTTKDDGRPHERDHGH
jgi:putative DNA methylase